MTDGLLQTVCERNVQTVRIHPAAADMDKYPAGATQNEIWIYEQCENNQGTLECHSECDQPTNKKCFLGTVNWRYCYNDMDQLYPRVKCPQCASSYCYDKLE